jgi:hypothetical protein
MPEAFFEDTSLIKDLPNLFTKFNHREEFPQNLTEEEKQKLKRFDIYRYIIIPYFEIINIVLQIRSCSS